MNTDCIVGCVHEQEANADCECPLYQGKELKEYGKYFTSV